QADRLAAQKEAGRSGSRCGELELAELLFVAVGVAPREILGLLDHPVPRNASAERSELRVQALDFGLRQMRELLEPVEAERLQRAGELRSDAFHPAEVVGGLLFARKRAVNRGA